MISSTPTKNEVNSLPQDNAAVLSAAGLQIQIEWRGVVTISTHHSTDNLQCDVILAWRGLKLISSDIVPCLPVVSSGCWW